MAQDDVDVDVARNEPASPARSAQEDYPETPDVTVDPSPATVVATTEPAADTGSNARTLTIVGRGMPSSFEITVDGTIDVSDASAAADTTVLSGTTIEGTIENGTVQFRFTGDLTDVTFVDRGITGLSPNAAPHVHVDYAASGQSGL